jgi:hypothetical protein
VCPSARLLVCRPSSVCLSVCLSVSLIQCADRYGPPSWQDVWLLKRQRSYTAQPGAVLESYRWQPPPDSATAAVAIAVPAGLGGLDDLLVRSAPRCSAGFHCHTGFLLRHDAPLVSLCVVVGGGGGQRFLSCLGFWWGFASFLGLSRCEGCRTHNVTTVDPFSNHILDGFPAAVDCRGSGASVPTGPILHS